MDGETQTDPEMVPKENSIVYFLDDDKSETEMHVPICLHFPTDRKMGIKSPKIPIRLEGKTFSALLDTGAELCVIPKEEMDRLILYRKTSFDDSTSTREVQTLGDTNVVLRGPVNFDVEICGVQLTHPFYSYDGLKTLVMGIDLITAASLVIDTRHRCVWSYYNSDLTEKPNSIDQTASNVVQKACSITDDKRPVSLSDEMHESSGATVSFNIDKCTCRTFDDLASSFPSTGAPRHSICPCADPPTCAPSYQGLLAPLSSPPPASFHDSFSGTAQCASDTIFHAPNDLMNDSSGMFSLSALESAETELKTTVDQNLTSPKVTYADELPEHVNVLFIKTVEENDLDSSVARDLKDLLRSHHDTFAKASTDLGFCSILKHDIDTGDARPIKQSPRRPPLAARDAEDEILYEMLQAGVIEPSTSPWASPVCLVKKKDGTYRFCVDYRKVNAVSKRDAFPVPDIQDALDHLRDSKYFATFDLLSGYWQLGLTERAKERSAFCTRRGLFQFKRLPFGLAGAPSSFCRLMSIALRDLLWVICLCYLDDIIIFAKTPQELLHRLRQVLDRLREVGLKVKPSKCVLFQKEIKFLGHLVSEHGIEPVPDKLEIIKNWPTPHCLRDVRAFFGLASYYRRFVKGFATIAEPLTRLTKKQVRFVWTEEAQQAFDALKKALMDATTLAFPYPDRPCTLDTDASDVAIGAVLSQVVDGVERPIAFYSRIMNSAQRNYCTTRRELLAVVAALQHFRHYLLGSQVILRTDHHSLKWLSTFKRPEGILARWIETLAEYSYTVEHRPGRLHSNVDGVSRPTCKQCIGKTFRTPWVDEFERADELAEPLGVHVLTMAPEISDSEMKELQAEDPHLGPVIDWFLQDHMPGTDQLRSVSMETRNLWSQRPTIYLENGILVRSTDNDHTVQLVVPVSIRKQLFDNTHAGPLSAHLGSERTLAQMRQAYYWPGMRKDIFRWCQECTDCAQSKGPPTRPKGKLHKVITGAPMDIVAIDILSGLPVTTDGKKYILVVTDYFTKFAHAFALPDAEAPTCMRALYNGFFAFLGLPRQIHSDLGKNFESKLFYELCKLAGINKSRTTPFHPQSDGQTERMIKTILQMLRTTADSDPTNWPQRLDTIMAAYRMTVHKVTGVTPNMAMFGREVLFPPTLIAKPPEEPFNVSVPFVADLRDNLRTAHEKIRQATQSVAKTQKTYYDKNVKGPTFAVDQLVWLYWPRPPVRQKYRKLQKLWTGPWRILAFKTTVVVIIQNLRTKAKQTVHINRLSPCRAAAEIQSTQTNVAQSPDPTPLTNSTDSASESEHQTTTVASPESSGTTAITPGSRPQRKRRPPPALEPYIVG